jgi:hypothetical protein
MSVRESTTRYPKNLYMALGREHQHLHAHLARLNVLYEDLRLELCGVSEPEVRFLDGTGINFRKQYFMRRAIGTTWEFAEAFRLLDEHADFVHIRDRFTAEHHEVWQRCVEFFAAHEPELQKVRHDIGGHFGYKAALYAVQNLNPDADGCIKVRLDYRKNKGGIRYEFAEEVAATAMGRQKRPGETSKEFFARTFKLLSECFEHAVQGTDLLTVVYTLDRFR